MMVDLLGIHGANHADVIGAGPQVRHPLGKLYSTLPVTSELARAGPDLGRGLDEGQIQTFRHRLWQRLALPLLHPRLRIEQVELAWPALHKQEDYVLSLGHEMRCPGLQRIRLRQSFTGTCRAAVER